MDELIELIVRALIELFRNRSSAPKKPEQSKASPPKVVGPVYPQGKNPRVSQRPMPPVPGQQAILQELMRRGFTPAPQTKRRPGRASPPPPPKMAKPVQPVAVAPKLAATPPPPSPPPRISADAIGRLINSRPSALRTAYVLSETLQPPLALRSGWHLL